MGMFPDKRKDVNLTSSLHPSTPTKLPSGQALARRMRSINGYGSEEESPRSFRKALSERNAEDSSSSLKLLIGKPEEKLCRKFSKLPSQDIIEEITNAPEGIGGRPPSPRPNDDKQVYVERNRQLQVWEEWLVHTNRQSEIDIASLKYRRTASIGTPRALPALNGMDSDASD